MQPHNQTYYRLVRDDNTLFWLLQCVGWIGISLLTYLSLSVPYEQYEWSYLGHNIGQSLLGFMLSTPLRYLYRAVWNWGGIRALSQWSVAPSFWPWFGQRCDCSCLCP